MNFFKEIIDYTAMKTHSFSLLWVITESFLVK